MSDRLIVTPPNEAIWHALRAEDITSTESSALFDMSPYATRFELWHRKRSKQIVSIPDNERMRWGRRLQDAIAAGLAEDQGWVAEPMKEYIRLIDARMGASVDWRMIDRTNRIGLFEIKNVDYLVFRDQWPEVDGELEAPAHIEVQLQHQLHVSGYEWGAIGVLVAGNSPRVLIRERDPEVGAAIEQRVREFWQSVDAGQEPPPTMPDDAEFACKLYGYAEPGKVYDGRTDADLAALCAEYQRALSAQKTAEEDKKVVQAKILQRIGDAERALLEGFTISAALVGPAEIPAYTRKGYRGFRLTTKKVKEIAA